LEDPDRQQKILEKPEKQTAGNVEAGNTGRLPHHQMVSNLGVHLAAHN
jgi:hypothetical protein